MKYRYNEFMYKTGSQKGFYEPNDTINIKKYYYIRLVYDKYKYLKVENGKGIFTEIKDSTPFSEKYAVKFKNKLLTMFKIEAEIFSTSKKI